MSVIGIVAALRAEARTLGPVRSAGHSAAAVAIQTLPDGNLLAVSGMGAEAAAGAARALVAAGARGLLSFGLAGGLDPDLEAGTVLLPRAVTDGAARTYATQEPWRERLANLLGAPTPHAVQSRADIRVVNGGILLSVAQPLSCAADKSQAWARTGAYAVDMESGAIAAVAGALDVSFAVARVVVDTAADSLPRSVQRATSARGAVAYPRLICGLLRRPAELPALLKLSRRYRLAMRSLRFLGRQGLGPS